MRFSYFICAFFVFQFISVGQPSDIPDSFTPLEKALKSAVSQDPTTSSAPAVSDSGNDTVEKGENASVALPSPSSGVSPAKRSPPVEEPTAPKAIPVDTDSPLSDKLPAQGSQVQPTPKIQDAEINKQNTPQKSAAPTPPIPLPQDSFDTPPGEQENINDQWSGKIHLSGAPLGPVLRMLARHCGYNYIEPPDPNGVLGSETVTVRLSGVTPQQAFEAITKSRGFKIQNEGEIITILRPDMTTPEYIFTKSYPLKHLEVLWVLQEVANLVGVKIETPNNTLSSYPDPSDQYSASSSGSAGASFGTGTIAGTGDGAATGGGVPNEPRWLPSLPFDSPLHRGGFREASDGGESVIFVDRRKNAIVLRATQKEHDVVRDYLASIDHPEDQILIQTRIVEVSNVKDLTAGIDWSKALSNPGLAFSVRNLPAKGEDLLETGEFLFYPGGMILNWPNAEVVFRDFERKNLFKNLAQPAVITRSGVPVAIRSTRSEYVEQYTSSGGTNTGGGTVVDQNNQYTTGFQSFQTGVTIDVVGRILSDDFIDLNVNPVVAQQAGRTAATETAPSGLPIIDTRSAQTTVRVKSGDTIVIGGLTRLSKSDSKNGMPLLSDIPLLGDFLFGERNKENIKSNLLIFVTPKIIPADQRTVARTSPAEANFMDDADRDAPLLESEKYHSSTPDKHKQELLPSGIRPTPTPRKKKGKFLGFIGGGA